MTGNLTANETLMSLFEPSTEKLGTFNNITGTDTVMLPHGICKVFQEEPRNMITRGTFNWKNAVHLNVSDLNNDYHIYVYDSKVSTKFQVPTPFTIGDNIFTKKNQFGSVSYFKITLNVFMNELNDGSCGDYPDSAGHQSFGECVEQENLKKAMSVLGCMPAWMYGNYHCNSKIPKTTAVKNFSFWLASLNTGSKNGFHYESPTCQLPCNHIQVNV